MKRSSSGIMVVLLAWIPLLSTAQTTGEFDVFEKSISDIQSALNTGELSSVELVRQYLERIERFDRVGPRLASIVFINPNALERAEALDAERRNSGARGPLHGIPILLKDNYDTSDMPTSAGSLALAGNRAPKDGTQVRRLREAGAIILGKTNMHELARGITTIGSLGGQTRNPYDPARNPGGSSGGTGAAVAASFATVGMGSDTCGSIRIPSANQNLFGLRVSQGLSSRAGIVPLSHTQDVGGPLARTVTDLAIVLDATVGYDPEDAQTHALRDSPPASFTRSLSRDAFAGSRIGLLSNYLQETPRERNVSALVREAAAKMKAAGAELVEIEIPELEELLEGSGLITLEFKSDLSDYLGARPNAPVSTLAEVLERGLHHIALEQGFITSQEVDEDEDFEKKYREALQKRAALTEALSKILEDERLDALAYPTLREPIAPLGERQFGSSCSLSANSGLPAISIPAGFLANDTPVAIELLAARFDDVKLVAMAYAYEQAHPPRRAPFRTPALSAPPVQPYACRGAFDEAEPGENGGPFGGELQLALATQRLSFELSLSEEHRLTSVRLHRYSERDKGKPGPVLELLPPNRNGELEITNATRQAITEGIAYLAVSTPDAPQQAARCEISRR